jgi:2-polyprenyl-3-methyl-5-hydroxy-6-metoxy-1,4-benzoquinol methylase
MKGLFRSIRFRMEFGLARSKTWSLLNAYNIKDWYFQVMDEWPYWQDSKKGNDWIIKNIPKSATILDTGCGIGVHLIRLEKNGFSSLHGSDIDPEVIKAGQALIKMNSSNILLIQEDCLRPQREIRSFDVIVFMSWIYHQKDFSLAEILKSYLPYMSPNCKIVINLVEDTYKNNPNHNWHSNDWDKPLSNRRATQYLQRHGHADVVKEIDSLPLKILHYERFHKKVPKVLYIIERSEIL